MFPTIVSPSNDLSLEEVIGRLAAHDAVDGVLTIGSTGKAALSPASDYDLVLFLNRSPIRLTVALTYIDHRLTDIIFVDSMELEVILAPETATTGRAVWGPGRLLPWLRNGTIAYDRTGRLKSAQTIAISTPEQNSSEGEIFSAWFGINYNLRQNLRMAVSDDETYLTALDLRLLYCLSDCWWYYFLLRKLPHRGEKAQVRYVAEHDPAFLALFRACLAEGDRTRKFALYRQLAALVVAPVGELWADDATCVQLDSAGGWHEDTPQQALDFWDSLLREG